MRWKRWLTGLLALLIVAGAIFLIVKYYSYIFAMKVEGMVVGIKRVEREADIYVVAVRNRERDIYTTRTADAEWGLVRPGQCAKAKFLPYPPWDLRRSGKYKDALLMNLRDCTEADGEFEPLPELRDPQLTEPLQAGARKERQGDDTTPAQKAGPQDTSAESDSQSATATKSDKGDGADRDAQNQAEKADADAAKAEAEEAEKAEAAEARRRSWFD